MDKPLRAAIAVVVWLMLLAAAGCASGADAPDGDQPAGYWNMSVEGLAAMMDTEDFLLVNVHIPYEGEIEGTDLFLPYDEVAERVDELPADKDATIVLYCRSGNMSAIAATTLAELGYTNVWNVEGGMIAWEDAA